MASIFSLTYFLIKDRSYIIPSAATTGSLNRSREIGQQMSRLGKSSDDFEGASDGFKGSSDGLERASDGVNGAGAGAGAGTDAGR